MLLKAFRHVSSHLKGAPFFMRCLKGWQWSVGFDMNLLMQAKSPCKHRSSLRFLVGSMPWTAQTLAWSISMPLCWTTKRRNFFDVIPNAQLKGFIFSLRFHNARRFEGDLVNDLISSYIWPSGRPHNTPLFCGACLRRLFALPFDRLLPYSSSQRAAHFNRKCPLVYKILRHPNLLMPFESGYILWYNP